MKNDMGGLLFDEVPVVGEYYKFGDWKLYAVHDEQSVKGFFGDYRWLSNFHECSVYFEGLLYPSSEAAYQAAKIDADFRHHLQKVSVKKTKTEWKKHPRIDVDDKEWNARKYDVMSVILFDKFYRNKDLRQKLIETGDKYLEETNHWHDNSWGICICEKCRNNYVAQNNLGQILTKIRDYWK